jgi:hypothetical protein
VLDERSRVQLNRAYAVSLRNLDPVPLHGADRLHISVGQVVRIVADQHATSSGTFHVEVIEYFYEISSRELQEIIGFHWTPDAAGDNAVTFPDLHVGRAITVGQTAIRPRDLHKAHIPTGKVSVPSVVRLVIAELGVVPLRPDWQSVLQEAERSLGSSTSDDAAR